MTKEELKQEAEESFEQYKVTDEDYVVSPYSDDMGEKMLMYNYEYYAEETYLRFYKQGYLAGAEPREKQIEELEQKLEQTEKDLADYQFNYPTIKELQKENAELRNKLEHRNCLDCSNHSSNLRMRTLKLEKECTKAKELLRYYFDCFKNDNKYTLSDFEVVEDTEQFLSEVEK